MDQTDDLDRAAIIAAIEGECSAYFAKDYAKWASYWVQGPHVRRWNWHYDVGMILHQGWEEMSGTVRDAMLAYPEPIANDIRREWLEFQISGTMAWVIFNQYSAISGDPMALRGKQHEMRIMQKCGGRWLAACVSNLKPRAQMAGCPVVQIDASGRVLWSNGQAESRLKNHPGLAINAGRLRAKSRAIDRMLQSAILWASGTVGFAQKRASLQQTAATGGALPILAEEVGEGASILCWVMPTDGMILVTFDDEVTADQRILAASVVFRLSEGQAKLARLLIDGNDLAQSAVVLGVSVNTARTQLQRMFDKIGVHNQAAMTRVLLSIAPPLR